MPNIFHKIKARLQRDGLIKTIKLSPRLIKVKIKSILKDKKPTIFSRYGVSRRKWSKIQKEHEVNFWHNPGNFQSLEGHENFRKKFFHINKRMFDNLMLDFPEGKVADVGCGPELGFLPYVRAKHKIAVEPLAEEFSQEYKFDKDVLIITDMAEDIPLLSRSVDAVYCINALDHMRRPYQALDEMYRILKPQGYLAMAVDIGGTKKHPIKLMEKDINKWFAKHPFRIKQQICTLEIGHGWRNVPLYVFQGFKK